MLGLKPTLAAGMYAGSLTCTPALAGVLEFLKSYVPAASLEQALSEPVVGYSLAYPMGVVGMILALYLAQRLWKVDYAREAQDLRRFGATNVRLQNRTICVTRAEATRETIHHLTHQHDWEVIFGRLKRNGQVFLAGAQTQLEVGDLVSVIGAAEDLDQVTAYLGQGSNEQLELDRSQLDFRRIFVSNPRIAGHRLRDLNLPQQYGAIVTRLRRGTSSFCRMATRYWNWATGCGSSPIART